MDKSALIEHWIPEQIRLMKAYNVPDSSGMVKLDAMESPFLIDQGLKRQWLDALVDAEINRYPDAAAAELKSAIRTQLAIPNAADIVLGNGSDELIQMIAMLVGGEGRTFIAPEPSFSMYRQISLATSTEFIELNLNSNFTVNESRALEMIDQYQPACIFLAYPNNPTGNCFSADCIAKILERSSGMVVVDEAYHAFCGRSFIEDIGRYENLVVLRTLSKSGFAGLRLGILLAGSHWTAEFEKLRLPYNINSLTQVSARFFLNHFAWFQSRSDQIIQNREKMMDEMQAIDGVSVYPSETNFLLFRDELGAPVIHEKLKLKKILIKNLHGSSPSLENCLRVTVSSEQENGLFIDAMREIHG